MTVASLKTDFFQEPTETTQQLSASLNIRLREQYIAVATLIKFIWTVGIGQQLPSLVKVLARLICWMSTLN